MIKMKLLAVAAALGVLSASPAAAEWQNIGSAEIGEAPQHGEFGGSAGPVRSIQVYADANPLDCRNVHVDYADGGGDDVFSGRLAQGANATFDIPGRAKIIRRVWWDCRSLERRAILRISAETQPRYEGHGRDYDDYRDRAGGDWGHGPDADRMGFLGTIQLDTNGSHQDLNGPDGAVRGLAFYADANPVYCRSIRVEFDDGQNSEVFSGPLAQGQTVYADLPGDRRHVRRISFNCRSEQRTALLRVRAIFGRR